MTESTDKSGGNRIRYEKPAIFDLNDARGMARGVCASGVSDAGGNCDPFGNSAGGDCISGNVVGGNCAVGSSF